MSGRTKAVREEIQRVLDQTRRVVDMNDPLSGFITIWRPDAKLILTALDKADAELAALRARNDRLERALARAKEQRDASTQHHAEVFGIGAKTRKLWTDRFDAELAAILEEKT